MDIMDWFAPACADDAMDPSELGLIQHAGEWYTVGQVLEFIRDLHGLIDAARDAGGDAAP